MRISARIHSSPCSRLRPPRRWRARIAIGGSCLALGLAFLPPPASAAQPGETAETAAPAEPSGAARRVVIRFLTDSDYPPFNFLDEEGVLTGFNVDLARAICLEIGAACDVGVRPWEELIPALKRGEADGVIAAHAISPATLAEVDFTDSYFFMPGRFAGRREEPSTEITPDGLDERRVGVIQGTAHEAFVKAFFPYSVVQAFPSADLARDALVQGKTDYLFDDAVSLAFWLNGTNSRGCCEFKGGPFLEPRYFGEGIAIAVPKNDPEVRRLINEALKRVREDGRMEELVQRYFPYRLY